jgi:hypothetical protein
MQTKSVSDNMQAVIKGLAGTYGGKLIWPTNIVASLKGCHTLFCMENIRKNKLPGIQKGHLMKHQKK